MGYKSTTIYWIWVLKKNEVMATCDVMFNEEEEFWKSPEDLHLSMLELTE